MKMPAAAAVGVHGVFFREWLFAVVFGRGMDGNVARVGFYECPDRTSSDDICLIFLGIRIKKF